MKTPKIRAASSTALQPDTPLAQTYGNVHTSYNYSVTCETGQIYTAWMRPESNYDDFDLYSYSDASHSTLLGSSYRSSGRLDLLVWKSDGTSPALSVYTDYGTGDAVIEVEKNETIMLNSPLQVNLTGLNQIDTFTVSTQGPKMCNITLDSPNTADYDILVYHLTTEEPQSYWEYVSSGLSAGLGVNETLEFLIYETGDFLFAVVLYDGTGNATLTVRVSDVSEIPLGSNLKENLDPGEHTCWHTTLDTGAYYVWGKSLEEYSDFEIGVSSPNLGSPLTTTDCGYDDLGLLLFSASSPKPLFVHAQKDEYEYPGEYRVGFSDIKHKELSTIFKLNFWYFSPVYMTSVTLEPGKNLDIELTFDESAEYELYLFSLSSPDVQSIDDSLDEGYHASDGKLVIEDYDVSSATELGILVVWISGDNAAQLVFNPENAGSGTPDFEVVFGIVIGVFFLIIVLGAVIGSVSKKQKARAASSKNRVVEAKKLVRTVSTLESSPDRNLSQKLSQEKSRKTVPVPPKHIIRPGANAQTISQPDPSIRDLFSEISTRNRHSAPKPRIQSIKEENKEIPPLSQNELLERLSPPMDSPGLTLDEKSLETRMIEMFGNGSSPSSHLGPEKGPLEPVEFELPRQELQDYEEFLRTHRCTPETHLYPTSMEPSEEWHLEDPESLDVLNQEHLRVQGDNPNDPSILGYIFYDPGEISDDLPTNLRSDLLQIRINICLNFNFLQNALQLMEVLDPIVREINDPFLIDAFRVRVRKVREFFEQGRFIPSHKIHTVLF